MPIGGEGKSRPWQKSKSDTAVSKKPYEKGKDTFNFIAGMFENPKSYGGSSYKDVEITTNEGVKFTIPKGVRFMVIESKLDGAKTPYALYAITKGEEE